MKKWQAEEMKNMLHPAPVFPLSTMCQIDNIENELIAFVHFGINTAYDREWGDPAIDYDPQRFNPANFDAAQWVDAVEAMGSDTLVFVAKHHDGFANWFTQVDPEYSVGNTPFKRDLLKEISDELHRRDMKLGIYLSTWDHRFLRRCGLNGAAYCAYYKRQFAEVLNPDVYGRVNAIWLDGAGASEMGLTRDQFQDIYDFLYATVPGVVLQCTSPDAAWVGNEEGEAPETLWNLACPEQWKMEPQTDVDLAKIARDQPITVSDVSVIEKGVAQEALFRPLQADARLSKGWFWHADDPLRDNVVSVYLNTVGRGTQLIMNYAPDADGLIPDEQIMLANRIRTMRDKTFSRNLLQCSDVTTSAVLGGDNILYGGHHLLTHESALYWATPDGTSSAWVCFKLSTPAMGNVIDLREYLRLGQRIGAVAVEGKFSDGHWRILSVATTIGSRRILLLPTQVTVSEIKVTVQGTRGAPLLSHVGFHSLALA